MSPAEKLRYSNMERFGFGPNVMKKTKVCARCGKIVKGRTFSCPDCGERLRETLFDRYKRKHTSCSKCDTVLAPGSLFCPNCGTRILPKAAGNEKGGGCY